MGRLTRNDRQVPDGWQVVRLGDVATLHGAWICRFKTGHGPIPVLRFQNGISGYTQSNRTRIPAPDVITYRRSGSIGERLGSRPVPTGHFARYLMSLYVSNFHGNSDSIHLLLILSHHQA